MLLVVDDVWSTDAAEHFMIGGADCARVLTTRQRNVTRELLPATGLLHEVRKLGTDDGFRLLDSVAHDAAVLAPEALRALVSHVDGLPIALVLIGNMLKLRGRDADRVREVLQSLNDINAVFGQRKRAEYPDDSDAQGGLRNLTPEQALDDLCNAGMIEQVRHVIGQLR